MKITLWCVMVVIDITLLILSFVYNNIFLTILCFAIALTLNKFKNIISIPKQFENLNAIYSARKNKKIQVKK